MPCSDVTERISLELDDDSRLLHYAFSKRTCGQGVGRESLLLDQLHGRPAEDLLEYEAGDYLAEFPIGEELLEFLSLKHLYAIKSALEVFCGVAAGGKHDEFAVSDIAYADGRWTIHGNIAVDLVTDRIKSCGNCKGCGQTKSKKKKTTKRAAAPA